MATEPSSPSAGGSGIVRTGESPMYQVIVDLTGYLHSTRVVNAQQHRRCSIQIDATTWGSAVVELQWSLDGSVWSSFDEQLLFTSTRKEWRNIDVSGVYYLRLRTTTVDSSASNDATATLQLFIEQGNDPQLGAYATRPLYTEHGTRSAAVALFNGTTVVNPFSAVTTGTRTITGLRVKNDDTAAVTPTMRLKQPDKSGDADEYVQLMPTVTLNVGDVWAEEGRIATLLPNWTFEVFLSGAAATTNPKLLVTWVDET